MNGQRSEIDEAEHNLRRGVFYALLIMVGLVMIAVMLGAAIGLSGAPRLP